MARSGGGTSSSPSRPARGQTTASSRTTSKAAATMATGTTARVRCLPPPSLSPESASYPPPLLITPSHLCDRYDTYNYRGGRTSDPPASAAYHPQSSWWPRPPEGHDSAAYHPQVSDSAGYHPQPPASAAYHPQPPAPATTASGSAASSPNQAQPAFFTTYLSPRKSIAV